MLKSFLPSNSVAVPDRGAVISIWKSGQIVFSTSLCAKIGLKAGDGIEFMQDEDRSTEWSFKPNPEGFKLKGHTKQKYLGFGSQTLRKEILTSLGINLSEGASYQMRVNPVATVTPDLKELHYIIITKSIVKAESHKNVS